MPPLSGLCRQTMHRRWLEAQQLYADHVRDVIEQLTDEFLMKFSRQQFSLLRVCYPAVANLQV
jgi:hypothetical protein